MIRPPRTSATGDPGQAPNVESRVFAASVDETTDVVRRMLPREVASVTEPTEGYFCWIVPKSGYAVHWNLRTVGLADGQSEVVLEAQVVPNPWMLLGGLLFVFATFGIGLLLVISFASQGGAQRAERQIEAFRILRALETQMRGSRGSYRVAPGALVRVAGAEETDRGEARDEERTDDEAHVARTRGSIS